MKINFSKKGSKILLFTLFSFLILVFLIGFLQIKSTNLEDKKVVSQLESQEELLDLKIKALMQRSKRIGLTPLKELPIISTSALEELLTPLLQEDLQKIAEELAKETLDYTQKFINQVQGNDFISEKDYFQKLQAIDQKVSLPEKASMAELNKFYSHLRDELLLIQPPPKWLDFHKGLVFYTSMVSFIINKYREETDDLRKMFLLKIIQKLLGISNGT